MPVTNERYTNEFFSAAVAGWPHARVQRARQRVGAVVAQRPQPPRPVRDLARRRWRAGASRYKRVVERGAKALWPMWAADGKSLFFMSDRSGAENIWQAAIDGAAARGHEVRRRAACCGPASPPTAGPSRSRRDFGIWTLDTASGRTAELEVELRGAPAAPAGRAPAAHEPVHRSRAVARRQEGRVRRARRGVRGVGEGRRRRRARDHDAGARVRRRVGARQPAPVLRLEPRRRSNSSSFVYDFDVAARDRAR